MPNDVPARAEEEKVRGNKRVTSRVAPVAGIDQPSPHACSMSIRTAARRTAARHRQSTVAHSRVMHSTGDPRGRLDGTPKHTVAAEVRGQQPRDGSRRGADGWPP